MADLKNGIADHELVTVVGFLTSPWFSCLVSSLHAQGCVRDLRLRCLHRVLMEMAVVVGTSRDPASRCLCDCFFLGFWFTSKVVPGFVDFVIFSGCFGRLKQHHGIPCFVNIPILCHLCFLKLKDQLKVQENKYIWGTLSFVDNCYFGKYSTHTFLTFPTCYRLCFMHLFNTDMLFFHYLKAVVFYSC